MSFSESVRCLFDDVAGALFRELRAGEELNLNLVAEDQTYVRFNSGRVRQASGIVQRDLDLVFQADGRRVAGSLQLSGQKDVDVEILRGLILRFRAETEALPEDPFLVPMANHGTSDHCYAGRIPEAAELIESIAGPAQGTDFAGFLAAGPQIRANRNSAGQAHWFETETFFVDYSLYTVNASGENKAVKGLYADRHWEQDRFAASVADSRAQLDLLRRDTRTIAPGGYRVYLAPAALAELIGMFSWGAVSYGAWRKGDCALKKLVEGKARFSEQFSLAENFELGLTKRFNSLGEVAPARLPVIERGELKNFLVSSRSAREYGVASNAAEPEGWSSEYLRSPEVATGDLPAADVLRALGSGLCLGNLHYLNWSDAQNARVTGMTRYACFWVENGEIIAPIRDLRFDDSLYRILGSELQALTREAQVKLSTDTYGHRALGGSRMPGAVVGDFRFTL